LSEAWLTGDAANTLAQRNSTNAQTFRLYNTYTSPTFYERLNLKGKASANFELGPENGSAGGTLRGLTLGGYTAGSGTITPWLSFTSAGAATFPNSVTFSKLVAHASAEITNTTGTITLNDGNHQTLSLNSGTGALAVTITAPSNVSGGTIIVVQHATTVRNVTWAVSAGAIKWMGVQPTWTGDATSSVRIVSWRYNGSVMYLASTEVAV
jgi:hypothetical protein